MIVCPLALGQEIYVVGGEYFLGHGDWNRSVWKYNVWSETWTFETRYSQVQSLESLKLVMGQVINPSIFLLLLLVCLFQEDIILRFAWKMICMSWEDVESSEL